MGIPWKPKSASFVTIALLQQKIITALELGGPRNCMYILLKLFYLLETSQKAKKLSEPRPQSIFGPTTCNFSPATNKIRIFTKKHFGTPKSASLVKIALCSRKQLLPLGSKELCYSNFVICNRLLKRQILSGVFGP